jgi:hypothetical protein
MRTDRMTSAMSCAHFVVASIVNVASGHFAICSSSRPKSLSGASPSEQSICFLQSVQWKISMTISVPLF